MSAQPHAPQTMTETEYLAFEDNTDVKHEFVNGDVYAMIGATVRHNLICNNTGTSLTNQLSGKNCIVVGSDTRVKVDSAVSYR